MIPKTEHGIPIPQPVRNGCRWPGGTMFQDMEVGDSKFFANRSVLSVRASSNYTKQKLGYKFVARTVVEDGVSGTRIWRIA